MYMYQKKLLKWQILSFSFLAKFGPRPCTIVQGLWPNFGATLKIHKKSNFDWNNVMHVNIMYANVHVGK